LNIESGIRLRGPNLSRKGEPTPFCCEASIPLEKEALGDARDIKAKNNCLVWKREDTIK